MALVSFSANTKILSADVNANFTGVTNWSLMNNASSIIKDMVVPATGTVAISSGLVGTFSNINYHISGQAYSATSIANKTYTASKDTYVDINTSGTVTYTEVANGAASPALTASNIRVAKVVTSGSAITSVTQIGSDSLGNLFLPTPLARVSILRQDDTTNTQQRSSVIITGWGIIVGAGTTTLTESVAFGITFLQRPIVLLTQGGDASSSTPSYGSGAVTVKGTYFSAAHSILTTGFTARMVTGDSTTITSPNSGYYQWIAIGEVN